MKREVIGPREKEIAIIFAVILNVIILISAGILLNVTKSLGIMSDAFSKLYIIPIILLILFFISFQIRSMHDSKGATTKEYVAILVNMIYSIVFTLMIVFPNLWKEWINVAIITVFIINSAIPIVLVMDTTYCIIRKRK